MSIVVFVVFFKQKTAYEMRISDWSSDVCSSDLTKHATKAGVVWGACIFRLRTCQLKGKTEPIPVLSTNRCDYRPQPQADPRDEKNRPAFDPGIQADRESVV